MRVFAISVSVVALGLTASVLSGCGDVKRSLGFEKSTPDEFEVMAHPPLSMPPDYALRPPRPGEKSPIGYPSASQKAQNRLLGTNDAVPAGAVSSGELPDAAESSLLQQAGAGEARPDIRQVLNAEAPKAEEQKDGFWAKMKAGKLLGDFGREKQDPAMLDAEKEMLRLREQRQKKALGKTEEDASGETERPRNDETGDKEAVLPEALPSTSKQSIPSGMAAPAGEVQFLKIEQPEEARKDTQAEGVKNTQSNARKPFTIHDVKEDVSSPAEEEKSEKNAVPVPEGDAR